MNSNIETFDAVYYSHPVPSSLKVLTYLSLIFDKIHFPGVYLPYEGIDEQETKKEIKRIQQLGIRDRDDLVLVNCMIFALYNKHFKDICVFPGKFGYCGIMEEGSNKLTLALEELIYGPPADGFTPTPIMGFAKGLPGNKESGVNGPSWISYPANALLYANNYGLPLINDNPHMPVPNMGTVSLKSNAKYLSTILALESVNFILPKLKELRPEEIKEFRDENIDLIKPFRIAMLKLSKELNVAISADSSIEDIGREAKFLVETTVYPELEILKRVLEDRGKPWHSRVIDLAQDTPELIANVFSIPFKIASVLKDIKEEKDNKKEQIKNNGYTFLLKIKDLYE